MDPNLAPGWARHRHEIEQMLLDRAGEVSLLVDTGAGLDANRQQIHAVLVELAALREEIRRLQPPSAADGIVEPAAGASAGDGG